MTDLASAIQRALFARLTSDADVAAMIGDRVFDRVIAEPTFPYLTIFDVHLIEDGADGIEADEAFFDVHVWSRAVGALQTKAIAGAVRKALHHRDLDLGDDHALVELAFRSLRVLRDPDGKTTHGVVTFQALTESD